MYTLLTGATGLVGRYLVRDLLLNEHQLAVVVRPSRRQSASDRMEEILQHWERELGRALPRPVVISGDICQPGFGFSEEDAEWVSENCSSIIHSAAILEFYGKDRAGEPWRTNLNGTENMIALCRDLRIHDIHYVSTAYVAGIQEGRVMESSLSAGQTFRNDYEESKFLAESLVRQIDFADHVTVYRPAVIAGDSRTGYTNTYHGIYLYLRLMALMIPAIPLNEDGKHPTPIRLRMTGDERRNIIPVEWVSAVMTRIFESPEARGLTFHIAPDHPIKVRQIIQYCADFFNSTGAEFIGADAPEPAAVSREENEDQYMFERLYKENMETYAPYERTDNIFDLTNTKRFAGDIVCPVIDETVMHRYIEYGNEDRWGKRKLEWVEPAFEAMEVLHSASNTSAIPENTVGIDLSGPGGLQATLQLSAEGICSVERGLPPAGTPVLRMTAVDFGASAKTRVPDMAPCWDDTDPVTAVQLSELLISALQISELETEQKATEAK
ncbi:MAG: SDR family oxidoreductase [Planctomycetaceae bacterium]|nr:SDR family oxidoreductase [Planctomycetaceae bacterium]